MSAWTAALEFADLGASQLCSHASTLSGAGMLRSASGQRGVSRPLEDLRFANLRQRLKRGVESPSRALERLAGPDAPSWAEDAERRGIFEHAIENTRNSDVLLSSNPARWSPLGDLNAESARELSLPTRDGVGLAADQDARSGNPVLSFILEDEVIARLTFEAGGFILPLPQDWRSVSATISSSATAWRPVEGVRRGAAVELVLWRVYSGENSWVRDVLTAGKNGVHRLSLRGLEGASVAVGRVVRVRARHLGILPSSPFYTRLLSRSEGNDPATATEAPRLDDASSPCGSAAILIHGTMSHGMQLAQAVLAADARTLSVPVRRFEHDTWLPLEENAQELARLIDQKILGRVCLIAHSRGGLVAARAADILARSGTPRATDLVSLGTPFAGTPVATTPGVIGLGLGAVTGALVYAGASSIDPLVRLIGLALRMRTPAGIQVMQPGNAALPMLCDAVPPGATHFAAEANGQVADKYGLALASGLGQGTFGDLPNDMVVSVESALAARGHRHELGCDHFSYLEEPFVMAALRAAVNRL